LRINQMAPEPTEHKPAPDEPIEPTAAAETTAEDESAHGAADAEAAEMEAPAVSAVNDGAQPYTGPDFGAESADGELAEVAALDDVELDVRIELGRTEMYIEDVLKLAPGAVVQLDRLAGDPVDVYVNNRLVARGEVLVLNDNFCVRVSDILAIDDEADGTFA
jgi:flagellar motor switch protein FliN/FliY